MACHNLALLLVFVLANSSLYGMVNCNPYKRSASVDVNGANNGQEECVVDPGLERRTILLEEAATTWGATLPPMLDRLTEISNAMQKPPVVVEPSGMDCSDLFQQGHNVSGIYKIGSHDPRIAPHEHKPFYAYCDMESDGGGWTVFQRRFEGTTDFYRGLDAYIEGFGHLNSDHWLGLERIYHLAALANYELRVDLEAFDGVRRYAKYDMFRLSDKIDNFMLHISGYSGDAGDALAIHHHQEFTTKDADHDNYDGNCANHCHGAWWYNNCQASNGSNLNGLYLGQGSTGHRGIQWTEWTTDVLKKTEMKMRRKN